MAAVLKTVERQRSGGSNPSASAQIAGVRQLFSLRLRDSSSYPPPLRGCPQGHAGSTSCPAQTGHLRFAGCLPVVASLLPPGTRLTALRPSGPQNCHARTSHRKETASRPDFARGDRGRCKGTMRLPKPRPVGEGLFLGGRPSPPILAFTIARAITSGEGVGPEIRPSPKSGQYTCRRGGVAFPVRGTHVVPAICLRCR